MKGTSKFDAALPAPYSDNWRQAERAENEDAPRYSTYQAPGSGRVSFILDSFSFSGGQSVDTAEYPFNGLWSNERLNEKPQTIHIQGYIRDAEYIKIRNAFIESLRIRTSDDTPGYIDLPFWGRFPVVVVQYDISEKTDEKGQCELSLDFTRAGVSAGERTGALPNLGDTLEAAGKKFEAASIANFENKLKSGSDINTLWAGFGKVKAALAGILGRVQAAEAQLNAITAEINGISSLIAQGIRAPGKLAQAQYNALASIAAGLIDIKNAAESYMDGGGGLAGNISANNTQGGSVNTTLYPPPPHNNERNVAIQFLSAANYTMDVPAVTVAQQNTKEAIENLYRAGAFYAVCRILPQMHVAYQKAIGYWNLLLRLYDSIDRDDPSVYAAMDDMRIAVSRELSAMELSAEMYRNFNIPLPLLYIAHYLGCDEAKLRELNTIADSFNVRGDIVYV